MLSMLLLLAGLVLALGGAELLVRGSSALAARLNLPGFVIGVVVVGFGTSMPEFAVNIFSAARNHTELAISNILGSNLFNMLLILGAAGLVAPFAIPKPTARRDMPMNLLAALMVGVCGNKMLIDGTMSSALLRTDGLVFLAFFVVFMWYTLSCARAEPVPSGDVASPGPLPRAIAFTAAGLAGLLAGGECIVRGAAGLAETLGMDHHTLGLVIVGPGTSLPELAASIIAVRKGEGGLAVGNVVGSNIFNVFFTLGVTALIAPVPLHLDLNVTVAAVTVASVFLLVIANAPGMRIGRVTGAVLTACYLGYMVYVLVA